MADLDDLIGRLESIESDLTDLSISLLRDSLESGDAETVAQEKRVSRARRAVEKAAGLLAGMPSSDD
jgi:hypothetical protein